MKKNLALFLKQSAAPLAIGVALIASPAFAQDTTAGDDEEILVTGSRIPQPNLEGASPVTVVGPQDIQNTGTTRIEDLLNSLPQVFAGQGSNISNASTGTSTVNLRGLGSERNLVLVNGRRLLPGDPGSSAADLNAIPAALIQRVDVLTGGASSVYGADAVTGVVNFIMDTNFEGFKVDAQYSAYQHNNRAGAEVTGPLNARGFPYPTGSSGLDGGTIDATVSFGASFDDGRGHVTAYAGYRKSNAILQAARDYSSCTLNANATTSGYTCGGSATSANGTFIIYDSGGVPANFTSTLFQVGPNRTFTPGSTPYNFGPVNYYQRPDERYTAGFFADYEISAELKPYLEFMFMDDRTVAQIAASGDFGNTLSVNCDNPLLSAQQRGIVCDTENLLVSNDPARAFDVVGNSGPGATPFLFTDPSTGGTYTRGFAQLLRRNVEGGGRRDDRQHTSYRGVFGVKGDLDKVWSYDVYFQYGRTIFSETYFNDFSVTRLGRALDVVDNPNTAAVDPVCRSVLDGTDANCVPWDIFATGQVSQASLNYLQVPGFQRGINGETVASGVITGRLGDYGIQTPWASEGVGIAIGAEYRKESLDFSADATFQTGDLAGQGAPTLPVAGSFNVKELFAEARIPLVSNNFIDLATMTAGYRYSSYENSAGATFSTNTYKVEGEIGIIPDFRLRGGYNRAVRAPTVQDLFSPNFVGLDGASDPCAGFAITAADTGCIAQGLTVGQFVAPNPASQYNGLFGGNALLNPEVADTYTVGVVFQPTFIPKLAISVDWYRIDLTGAIGGIGADTILTVCDNTADAFFCGLVHRDATGSLWRTSDGYVNDTTQNIGGVKTTGVDINASYSYEVAGIGQLSATYVGTFLGELTTDTGLSGPGIEPTYDCAGLYGNVCSTPNPKYRHTARIGWTSTFGLGASLRWRHFAGVIVDTRSTNSNLKGVFAPENARIDPVDYFDLSFNFRIGKSYGFRLGVNNILDKSPPITGSGARSACPSGPCNGNSWAQVYDPLGRYLFAGVTLDF